MLLLRNGNGGSKLRITLIMKGEVSSTRVACGAEKSAGRKSRHFVAPALRFPSRGEQFLNASATMFWVALGAPLGVLITYIAQLTVHLFKK